MAMVFSGLGFGSSLAVELRGKSREAAAANRSKRLSRDGGAIKSPSWGELLAT
jgi:hypothetical protein